MSEPRKPSRNRPEGVAIRHPRRPGSANDTEFIVPTGKHTKKIKRGKKCACQDPEGSPGTFPGTESFFPSCRRRFGNWVYTSATDFVRIRLLLFFLIVRRFGVGCLVGISSFFSVARFCSVQIMNDLWFFIAEKSIDSPSSVIKSYQS